MIPVPDVFLYKIPNSFDTYLEFRTAIRESLYINLNQTLNIFPQKSEILDLSKPPTLDTCGISISHTKNSGAYVLSKNKLHIGLDMELSSRIQKEPLLRVSTLTEVETAPSLAHLWTAKEAAFKSFYKLESPKVLSQIEVCNWKLESANLFSFSYYFNNSKGLIRSGEGYSWQENCLNLSFCTISS